MIYARITGTGSCLPGKPVTNEDLIARGVDTSDEWIVARTGIRSRYLADAETASSMLATEAARKALAAAGRVPDDVDLIIVGTSTPDQIFPSTATLVQNRLGIRNGGVAFDLQAVCAGFVYALSVAEKFIRSGTHQCALVIGADVFSRVLDWSDRTTCVLFGDGAGAVVLEASDRPGIRASVLHADGSYNQMLQVPGQIVRGGIAGDPFVRMDGKAVFRFAVNSLSKVAEEVIHLAGVETASVDWMVPHQANIRIIQATAKHLGMPMEKVVTAVDQHGNTSAASVPLALNMAIEDGRIKPGQRILIEGIGGGFTWGAVLVDL